MLDLYLELLVLVLVSLLKDAYVHTLRALKILTR